MTSKCMWQNEQYYKEFKKYIIRMRICPLVSLLDFWSKNVINNWNFWKHLLMRWRMHNVFKIIQCLFKTEPILCTEWISKKVKKWYNSDKIICPQCKKIKNTWQIQLTNEENLAIFKKVFIISLFKRKA